MPLQQAVSASILREKKCKFTQNESIFDEDKAIHIPWNASKTFLDFAFLL